MAHVDAFEATIQGLIITPLKSLAERLRRVLSEPAGQELLAALQQDYAAEHDLARRLRTHMSLMPNDLFRDLYAQIATESEHHARQLAEHIHVLVGTTPPAPSEQPAEPTKAMTIWRLIAADMAAIDAASHRYQEQLGWILDAGTRQLLQQLRVAKHQHRTVLADLLARIDSYALPEINHHQPT